MSNTGGANCQEEALRGIQDRVKVIHHFMSAHLSHYSKNPGNSHQDEQVKVKYEVVILGLGFDVTFLEFQKKDDTECEHEDVGRQGNCYR